MPVTEAVKSYEEMQAENLAIPRDEFIARFKAHMLKEAKIEKFDDGMSVAEYADMTAPTYYDEPDQRADGPEACAESDISYWGE